jgi:tetratricopeptide (TPR) repeat protein
MRINAYAEAVRDADEALVIAERRDLGELIAEALNNKAACFSYLGRTREAIALMEGALEVASSGGFVVAELRARSNLGSVVWDRDPARARAVYWAGYERSLLLGNRGMANWMVAWCGIANMLAGRDWDLALDEVREALAAATSPRDEIQLVRTLALLASWRGEPTAGSIARIEGLLGAVSDPVAAADVAIVRGQDAFIRGDYDAARAEYMEAARVSDAFAVYLPLAILTAAWGGDVDAVERLVEQLERVPEAGQPVELADLALGHGLLAGMRGQRVESLAHLREAFGRYTALGVEFERARGILTAIRVLGPDEAELQRHGPEAREVFERVGAVVALRQLDEALAPAVSPGSADRSSAVVVG